MTTSNASSRRASTTSRRSRRSTAWRAMSARLDSEVLLKREDLQPVFSFKLRGAYNKIAHLSESVASRGVICASAGNHAQGVALAAKHRGIAAVIVMPQTTPQIKVSAVAALGGEVVLHGDEYDSAYEHALASCASATSPSCIRSTIRTSSRGRARSAWRSCASRAAISMPSSCRWAAAGSSPASPVTSNTSHRARDHRRRAGRRGGDVRIAARGEARDARPRRHVRRRRRGETRGRGDVPARAKYVDEIVLVNTDEICAAIQDIFEDTRTIVEPSGALAVAGLKNFVARGHPQGKRFVAINSGANMNFDRLRYVAERADVGPGARRCSRSRSPSSRAASSRSAVRSARATSPNSTIASSRASRADLRRLRADTRASTNVMPPSAISLRPVTASST